MIDRENFKTRKSWNEFGHSHFLTFSTLDKLPYLEDDRICRRLGSSINDSAKELEFVVFSYVFMPDHVHLLIHPIRESYDMSEILQSIKQGPGQISRNKNWIQTRLWEPGGGHDSNITTHEARVSSIGYAHQNPVRKEIVVDPLTYKWSSANWYVTGEQGDVYCTYMGELWN